MSAEKRECGVNAAGKFNFMFNGRWMYVYILKLFS